MNSLQAYSIPKVNKDDHYITIYSGSLMANKSCESVAEIEIYQQSQGLLTLKRLYFSDTANIHAVYEGLILGLQEALDLDNHQVIIQTNNQQIIDQLRGIHPVQPNSLVPSYERVITLLSRFQFFQLEYFMKETIILDAKELQELVTS